MLTFVRIFALAVVLAGIPSWVFAGSPHDPRVRLQVTGDALLAVAALPALLIAGAAVFMTGIDHGFLRGRHQAAQLVLIGFRRAFGVSVLAVVLLLAYRALDARALRDHANLIPLLFGLALSVALWAYLAAYVLMRQMLDVGLIYLQKTAGE